MEKWYPKLQSKTTKNKDIWPQIADEMLKEGYTFTGPPNNKEMTKWSNLLQIQKEYTAKVTKSTGESSDILDDKPAFYEEIKRILGCLFQKFLIFQHCILIAISYRIAFSLFLL